MTVNEELLGRARLIEAMADEDEQKGKIGEIMAARGRRGAMLLRRFCASGDPQDYQMASEILDGGDAEALDLC